MVSKALFSSASCEWATPQRLFDDLNAEFNFTLDPCATPDNAKCRKFFTKEQDGLKQDWTGERVFCNPPYGRCLSEWVKKCADHVRIGGGIAVMLIPARTDTKWFHEYIYNKAEVRFIKGRLYFGEGKGRSPFPSMIVIFQ